MEMNTAKRATSRKDSYNLHVGKQFHEQHRQQF